MSCLLFLRLGVIMGQKSETDFCIHRIASELVRGPTNLIVSEKQKDEPDKGSSLVGVWGFEPQASWTRTKRDTKLRHTPISLSIILVLWGNVKWENGKK